MPNIHIQVGGPVYELWSDADTWADTLGHVPLEGEDVEIAVGKNIALDISPPSLATLTIAGTFLILPDAGDLTLEVEDIHMEEGSNWWIGNSEADPYVGELDVIFTGPETGNAHDRGMMTHSAGCHFFGTPPTVVWSRLAAHALVDDTSITIEDTDHGWKAGDIIVLGQTEHYGEGACEEYEIASVAGAVITLTTPITADRYGVLQYMTDTGPSLTAGTFTKPHADVPGIIDERAGVCNITRNIRFQSVQDSALSSNNFGFHIMIMDLDCVTRMHGVALIDGGQQGNTGRYPIHWHLNSWTKDGIYATTPYLGAYAAGEAYLSKCVTYRSRQRGVVFHSTDGIICEDHAVHDCKGHAYFFEDGAERGNTLTRWWASKVRGISGPDLLMNHEAAQALDSSGDTGASAVWLTNPDNEVTYGFGTDIEGALVWMSFAETTMGLSGPAPIGLGGSVPLVPQHIPLGEIHHNTGISIRGAGILLRDPVRDTSGNTADALYYQPDDNEDGTGTLVVPNVSDNNIFKAGRGAYRNRVNFPMYERWTTCVAGQHFAGATSDSMGGDDAFLQHSLVLAYTLNNANPDPPVGQQAYDWAVTGLRLAFATYHSTIVFKENVLYGFPEIIQDGLYPPEQVASGAFTSNDFYVNPVQKGTIRHTGNVLIDCFNMYLTRPPNLWGTDVSLNRKFTLAGVIYDPGIFGGVAGSWRTHDDPFFTDGGTYSEVPPNGDNGVTIDGQYVGFDDFSTGFDATPYLFSGAMKTTRQNVSTGATIGTPWNLVNGVGGTPFPQMRHVACRSGGRFLHEWPGETLPNWVTCRIDNLQTEDGTVNSVLMGISLECGAAIAEVKYYTPAASRTCTSTGSIANVQAGSGDLYYVDTANDVVWIKFVGDLAQPTYDTNSDGDLYRPHSFQMRNVNGTYGVAD